MKHIGIKSSVFAAMVDAAINDKKQDYEFTLDEYIQELKNHGIDMPYRTAQGQVYAKVKSGELVKRLVTIDRRQTNVYSEPLKTKKKP